MGDNNHPYWLKLRLKVFLIEHLLFFKIRITTYCIYKILLLYLYYKFNQ